MDYDSSLRRGLSGGVQKESDQYYPYEYVDSSDNNLEEYLIFQLRMSSVDEDVIFELGSISSAI